ncbi:MAG: caspase family protein, partial [Chitinispirillia bacterium]
IERIREKEETLFLFYYSGHANENSLLLHDEKYSLIRIKEQFNTIKSGIKIGIFDACHSGRITQLKGGKKISPFYLEDKQHVKGQVIIASSAAREQAQESDMLKGSIFTHHWINGLRGSADISGDKKVTVTEAYNYAYRKTVETTALTGGDIQHPVYKFNIRGQGNIVLTDFVQKGTGILFDKSFSGKFLVLSDHYTNIYADFFKKPEQKEVFISLNPGKYTAINISGNKTKLHHFQISEFQLYRVRKESFVKNVSPLNTAMKGQNHNNEDAAETKDTEPLSKYSVGIGIGGAASLHNPVSDKSFLSKILLLNSFYLNKNMNLLINAFSIIPGLHFGVTGGLNYLLENKIFQPMAGVGIGVTRFEKDREALRDEIGFTIELYTGISKRISDRVSFQSHIPFMACFNKQLDVVLGFDVVFIFSGKYKNVRVLKYN